MNYFPAPGTGTPAPKLLQFHAGLLVCMLKLFMKHRYVLAHSGGAISWRPAPKVLKDHCVLVCMFRSK